MQQFRDLKVWQRSHALAKQVYRITRDLPEEERFGITLQLRRAVVSVPTNIAEGAKRKHARDYGRFLNIAEASLAETDYLLYLSVDLGLLPPSARSSWTKEIEELSRMLYRLREKVDQTT